MGGEGGKSCAGSQLGERNRKTHTGFQSLGASKAKFLFNTFDTGYMLK